MKNTPLKSVSVLAASAMLVLSGLPTLAGDGLTDATVRSYEDQLASLQQKQEQALNELDGIRSSQSEAWMEIGKYDELLNYNKEMKDLASGQLEFLETTIADTKQTLKDTTQAILAQEQAFLDRMVATYMDETTDYVELILGSESIGDFLTQMERISAILEYDRGLVRDLGEKRASLSDDRRKLQVAYAAQKQRVADFESAIAENQRLYDQKMLYINSLVKDESSLINEYSYYKQLEDEKNAELEDYLAELAEQQRKIAEAYVGGTVWWPLDPAVRCRVSSEYGWRNLYGMQDFHLGIDLAAPNGTTVRAANAGKVLTSSYHWSYGNYVLIDHGGGIATLYAHLSSNAVSVGETVTAGQTVGWVGLTGNTFGYHLHFEVRENGATVNPRNYLVFP
ncbi:MAG: peptidoglycan DD-metalloendopeptidase family protein [Clostridia bacterium]|nr:peptidoglycan DD-metalloendopeptidase family protein [Clostridia bacterium]